MTKKDIELLKIICENGAVCKVEDFRRFDISADSRLQTLLGHGYVKRHLKGTDSHYAGDFEITGKGLAFLTDYADGRRRSLLHMLLTNVVLPIIVSFITALLTVLFLQ